jgi:hypothetical protein
VRAAEAKWKGTIDEARDFQLLWNGSRPGGGIGRKNKSEQKFLSQTPR